MKILVKNCITYSRLARLKACFLKKTSRIIVSLLQSNAYLMDFLLFNVKYLFICKIIEYSCPTEPPVRC